MPSLPICCPRCANSTYEEIVLPATSYHYGKIVCASCQRFIDWLPSPEVTAAFEERKRVIDSALTGDQITGWENLFFRQICNKRVISPKQEEKYLQICSRHGLGGKTSGSGVKPRGNSGGIVAQQLSFDF